MKNFNIGDIVKVTNTLEVYDTYKEAAEYFKLSNWKSGKEPLSDHVYRITHIGDMQLIKKVLYKNNIIIYVIKDIETGEEYIINPEGLEISVPEKWYLHITDANMEVAANEWRKNQKHFFSECFDIVGKTLLSRKTLLSKHKDDDTYYSFCDITCDICDVTYDDDYNDYIEITFEFFQKYINKQKTDINNMEYYISSDLLREYWDAATSLQKSFLNDNFTLSGKTTKEAIIKLYDMACSEWKPKIKKNHPDCFEEDKYFDMSALLLNAAEDNSIIFSDEQATAAGFESRNFIQVRLGGKFKNKALYLGYRYNWELINDDGDLILLPTKKM